MTTLGKIVKRLPPWVTPGLALGFLLSGCNMTLVDSIPPLPETLHAPVVAVTSFDNRAGSEGQWKLATAWPTCSSPSWSSRVISW